MATRIHKDPVGGPSVTATPWDICPRVCPRVRPVSIPAPCHHAVRLAAEPFPAAANYFPGRRVINSAQELRLSANSPEQLSGRRRASPPGVEDAARRRKF